MARGLILLTASQSRPIAFNVSAGRLATTTSASATSRRTTSRPASFIGSSVRLRLLRFICRNIAPSLGLPSSRSRKRNERAVLAAVASSRRGSRRRRDRRAARRNRVRRCSGRNRRRGDRRRRDGHGSEPRVNSRPDYSGPGGNCMARQGVRNEGAISEDRHAAEAQSVESEPAPASHPDPAAGHRAHSWRGVSGAERRV